MPHIEIRATEFPTERRMIVDGYDAGTIEREGPVTYWANTPAGDAILRRSAEDAEVTLLETHEEAMKEAV